MQFHPPALTKDQQSVNLLATVALKSAAGVTNRYGPGKC